jgi:hypothetical protein
MVKSCVFFAVRTKFLNIIMRSLHDVHEINAKKGWSWLSVRMIQLEN